MAFNMLETAQSLRHRFSGYRTGMKNQFADNKCKILSKHFGIGLCRNVNYKVNIIDALAGSRIDDNGIPIDCNWTRTQNHLVLKRTLNH